MGLFRVALLSVMLFRVMLLSILCSQIMRLWIRWPLARLHVFCTSSADVDRLWEVVFGSMDRLWEIVFNSMDHFGSRVPVICI